MDKKLLIIIKIVFISILIIIGLVFLYFYIWFRTGINDLKKQHNKNIEIETQNREDNIKIFNEYIINTYGKVAEKFIIEIKPAVVNYDTNFIIQVEFMDKPFKVIVDTENKKIYNDTFYKVLIKDMKFQHLYSEWVKKQIGIEDENVELYFNRAICGSRVIGDNIYIDFNKITDLNNLEEQICVNTHNIYIRSNHHEQGVDIKFNNIDDIKEVLNYSDLIEEKIRTKIFIDTNHFMPSENNHLFIYILSQNNEDHIITVMYDYDKNIKKYYYNDKDTEWIEYE